jgi:uncharacterized repeat protein (TIGR01451 family)
LPPEAIAADRTSPPISALPPQVWHLGTLAPGASGTLVVRATLDAWAGPQVESRAVISTDTPESRTDNNEDQAFTRVTTDLAVLKHVRPDPGTPGDPLTYTVEYANLGVFGGVDVRLVDRLPAGVTFETVVQQPPGWQGPQVGTGSPVTLTWYTPTLAAGDSGRIVYRVILDEDVPGEIVNRVRLANFIDDYDLTNNEDWVATAVQLLYFRALQLPNAVLLRWETAWEVNSYGFALLRSAGGQWGDARQVAFLPAQGRGGGGAAYSYRDTGLPAGDSYTYWLVEVDKSGQRTTFGSARAAALSEWPYRVYLPFSWRP